jgi:hypothetical protein
MRAMELEAEAKRMQLRSGNDAVLLLTGCGAPADRG